MDKISLNSHAKINLSLRVISKRPDGYHEIRSFMQGTGFHDVITIEDCSQKATKCNLPHCTINDVVVYLCTDAKTIPADMSNLAMKAAKAFAEACEAEGNDWFAGRKALLIELQKRLPVAAGIAGGSGNAAVCLLGLNELAGRPFTLRQLMSAGVKVGADVPFSVFMNAYRNREALAGLTGLEEAADAARISGIGDVVEAAESVPRHIVLANPGTVVSTKEAYEAMDSIGYSREDTDDEKLFVNDMESFTLAADSKAAELKSFMAERLDANELLMSGSGPTIVAYYKDANKAAAGMDALSELTQPGCVKAWLTDTGL